MIIPPALPRAQQAGLTALFARAEAIIFDVEGVAIDTEPMWDDVQAELLRQRGIAYDRAALKPLLTGRAARDAMTVLAARLGLPDDPADLERERHLLMLRRLAAGAGLMPGFRDLLAGLTGRWRIALATAMDPDLFAVADRSSGLSRLVDGPVVTLAEVGGQREGRGKPWPDLFLQTCRLLGLPPRSCLVIEDAPNGVTAAHRAGARCVAVATTHAANLLVSADAVVEGLAELVPAVRERLITPGQ